MLPFFIPIHDRRYPSVNSKQRIKAATYFAKVRFLGRRIPIAVRWQLLSACDARCVFCNLYKDTSKPPDTEFCLSVVDQLADMGTLRISFSGGEPLLRSDIGRIISHAKRRGISPSMNTNGAHIRSRVQDLVDIDLLKITVHGPREAHVAIQGGIDLYDQLMDGIEAAREAGIRFSLATTITRFNVDHLDFLVDLAQKHNTFVAFQPLKNLYRGIDDIADIVPEHDRYVAAIDSLLAQKSTRGQHIRNTPDNLKHIRHWPDYPDLPCVAGRMFAIIEADGTVMPCDRIRYDTPLPNLNEMSVREAWDALPLDFHCDGCGFCGALELNFAGQLHQQAFRAINKLLGN